MNEIQLTTQRSISNNLVVYIYPHHFVEDEHASDPMIMYWIHITFLVQMSEDLFIFFTQNKIYTFGF